MKRINFLTALILLFGLTTSCEKNEKSNLTLLGDIIPTDTPLVFGKGIISTDAFEFAITFSPKMDEIYFTRRKSEEDNKLFSMQFVDGKWTTPEIVSFSAKIGWDFEPHINPRGDKLYFGSLRPLPDSTKSSGLHQWYLERNENGWGKPAPLPSPIRDRFAMFLTSTREDKLYFTSNDKEKKEKGLFYAKKLNGEYSSVIWMGKKIHAGKEMVAHPYIAPDDSYIIFDAKKGAGKSDLYISFNHDGIWTEAYNLGDKVNTEQTEMCPSVSPDGKFLFFHRGIYEDEGRVEVGDIYWVDFHLLRSKLLDSIPK